MREMVKEAVDTPDLVIRETHADTEIATAW